MLEYGNVLSLGEVLLGYPNEYGKYTDRPLVDRRTIAEPGCRPPRTLPDCAISAATGATSSSASCARTFRASGSSCSARRTAMPEAGRALAETMVGRTLTGDPLLEVGGRPIPGVDRRDPDEVRYNQFTFDSDVHGTRCPLGAHIRRANPRNADLPGGPAGLVGRLIRTLGFGRKSFREDVIASARFHRILRRGREYGPVPPDEAASQPGGAVTASAGSTSSA